MFMAPVGPDFRMDWCDAELIAALASGLAPRGGWGEYVRRRLDHAHAYGFGSHLGFKASLLALTDGLCRELLAQDFSLVRILVTRDERAIEASIARQPGAAVLRAWNGQIRGVEIRHDMAMSYEALVADPVFEVARLADALGVVDPVARARAEARVAKPCS
jgi:hypothetical protein